MLQNLYFQNITSPEKDAVHRYGPFWTGPLHDPEILSRMSHLGLSDERRSFKYLNLWRGEIDTEVFVYDMSELSSHVKMSPPKIDEFMEFLNGHGHAAKSHVSPSSFKTDIPLRDLLSLYREFSPDAVR